MALHEVWLRCSYLASMQQNNVPAAKKANDQHEPLDGERAGWLHRPVLAHWQLECHGKVYEIGRKGAVWNPFNPITFHVSLARSMQEDTSVFYREKIGMTSKGASQIRIDGKDIVSDGNYHLMLRNCQTTVKKLAEAIIKTSDRDPTFSWPWRAAHVSMIIVAGVAAGGTAYFLWPVQGVIQVAGSGALPLTCPADWSMGGKFMTALQKYWSNGSVTNFVWRVGDKHLHSVPLAQLVGQWTRQKLVPLIKFGLGVGSAFLTLKWDPEWLEYLAQTIDRLMHGTTRAWTNFLEWLEGLLSRFAQKSNTVLLDGTRLQILA